MFHSLIDSLTCHHIIFRRNKSRWFSDNQVERVPKIWHLAILPPKGAACGTCATHGLQHRYSISLLGLGFAQVPCCCSFGRLVASVCQLRIFTCSILKSYYDRLQDALLWPPILKAQGPRVSQPTDFEACPCHIAKLATWDHLSHFASYASSQSWLSSTPPWTSWTS